MKPQMLARDRSYEFVRLKGSARTREIDCSDLGREKYTLCDLFLGH